MRSLKNSHIQSQQCTDKPSTVLLNHPPNLITSNRLEDEAPKKIEYRSSTPSLSSGEDPLLRPVAPSFHIPDGEFPNDELHGMIATDPDLLQTDNEENESDRIPQHKAPPPPVAWHTSTVYIIFQKAGTSKELVSPLLSYRQHSQQHQVDLMRFLHLQEKV